MARYIDADELMKRWEELSPRGRKEFDQVIMTQPTANLRENVRGEWITDTESALAGNVCSACGKVANNIFHKTNFCPNCGADMREV